LTVHPATHAIVQANYNHWMSNSVTGSSMWALTFSFAGIWGDLGVLGVVVYLLSWGFVWKYVCFDDVSRYLVATVIVFGAAYAWLEEPAYMLFVVSLIGLRYQRHQVSMQQDAGFDENMSRT